MQKMNLYLDNAATTPLAPEVLKEMNDFSVKYFANPSSQHSLGREALKKVEEARKKIADFIGSEVEEIIFTSGGTEADNLAIRGVALGNPTKKHIITTVIEHPAVYETCEALKKEGYDVDYVGVNSEGIVDVEEIKKKITKNTLLVSVMHVNNEVGTIQPLEEIGTLCKEKDVYFHTDAVQSFKKLDLDVKGIDVDLVSVSGHKINGPKGVGFLYSRIGTKMKPIVTGGGQEFGFRNGTENTVGIIGLAAALEVNVDKGQVKEVRDYIVEKLQGMKGVRINGSLDKRVYHNINASFYGIEGESLMLLLDGEGISVSTGSACSSKKLEESKVLKAIGVDELYIHGSLRMTLGSDMNFKKADYLIEKIGESVEKLRKMSPFKLSENEDV
jgi:cysteine desulfurase